MDATDGVGGDWFDVIPLSGARVALVVGDVVGHGITAAATMGRLRTAVQTLADMELPPDELLAHLDDLVLRLSEEKTDDDAANRSSTAFLGATCLYAVYDPVTRRCTMARAGHPPPVVVAPAGHISFPELPALPPLGLGGMAFEATEIELAENSLLGLYTDGLIEESTTTWSWACPDSARCWPSRTSTSPTCARPRCSSWCRFLSPTTLPSS